MCSCWRPPPWRGGTAPLPKLVDSLIVEVGLVGRCAHDGVGTVDEQAAQMLITALGNAHHHHLRLRTGESKTDPGGQTSVPELGAVADGRNDRRGGFWVNAFDLAIR